MGEGDQEEEWEGERFHSRKIMQNSKKPDRIGVKQTSKYYQNLVDLNPAIWLAGDRDLKLNRPRCRKPCSKNYKQYINRDLLSFRHLEMFWHTQENVRDT